jgi:hypothetical protein
MKFENFPTKRIVFILLVTSYIALTGYSMYNNKQIPTEFVDLVKMVCTFYFGLAVGERMKKE